MSTLIFILLLTGNKSCQFFPSEGIYICFFLSIPVAILSFSSLCPPIPSWIGYSRPGPPSAPQRKVRFSETDCADSPLALCFIKCVLPFLPLTLFPQTITRLFTGFFSLYSQMCSCLSPFISHPFINHLTTYFLPLGDSFLFFPLQSLSLTPSILNYFLLKHFSHASIPWHVLFTLPEITSPLPSRFTPSKQEAQECVPYLY